MPIAALTGAVPRLGLEGQGLLVAVSGGIDSVVLLASLEAVAEQFGLNITVGHVNHGLRGSESEADERFVRELAAARGRAFEVARVDPRAAREGFASRERPTLQEAARSLRYAALHAAAERCGAAHVVTAHTLDDQAETVLLRLLRGSGPDGLAGIPERSPDGRVVRPLLGVSRDEIERFADCHRLSWREDASNRSPAYTRNRVRARVRDLAQEFNPRLLRAIGDLAEAQRRDSEWIAAGVAREAEARLEPRGSGLAIDAKDWSALPEALARRVAREALVRCGAGRHVTRAHLARMCAFLESAVPGKRLELPGGLLLERRRGGFRLGPGAGTDPRSAC